MSFTESVSNRYYYFLQTFELSFKQTADKGIRSNQILQDLKL